MSTVRQEPWDLFKQVFKDLNHWYEQTQAYGDQSTVATSNWIPAVDIREEAQQFVLEADIPGVDPQAIEVSMENGMLTIKGTRELVDKEEHKSYRRVERVRGHFYRRFSLPETADAENIAASEKHGVLTITIPKKAVAQPRKIAVNIH
ncbi:heat-shock protein Hsp20 [Thioflexithrix psekupsensis]|uniref:Heat-shock protein Hsp20 n=1 Tax=Thioflexithrix psekupsensis TaxID=1570016 RepID=A0A251XDB6_9GAMM|nr:heat-shock protein Hsp20 [Thioflexithrix psekupsensis]